MIERAPKPEPPPAPPAPAWRWPRSVLTVGEVLQACHDGFDLVTAFVGHYGDRPIYALLRDGEVSPRGIVSQTAARTACHKYFGHGMSLTIGSAKYLLYKRKAGN